MDNQNLMQYMNNYKKMFHSIFIKNGTIITPNNMTTEQKKEHYARFETWYNSSTLMFGLILGTTISPVKFDKDNIECENNYMIYLHIYSISYNVYCCIMRMRKELIPEFLKPVKLQEFPVSNLVTEL